MQLVVVVLCMFPLSMIKSMDSLKVRNSITPTQTAPPPLHYHHLHYMSSVSRAEACCAQFASSISMFFMSAFAVLVVFRGVWVLSAPSIREDDYAAVCAQTLLEFWAAQMIL